MTNDDGTTLPGIAAFSHWIRKERQYRQIGGRFRTQAEVAKMAGIPYRAYTMLERGEIIPTYKQIAGISRVFRVSEDWLWLMAHHLPPDMYSFLVDTVQGEVMVKNLRRIMDKLEAETEIVRRDDAPPPDEGRDRRDRLRFFSALDVERHRTFVPRNPFPERHSGGG
jgi:transcriptional regulator with XRE-family HTH domain